MCQAGSRRTRHGLAPIRVMNSSAGGSRIEIAPAARCVIARRRSAAEAPITRADRAAGVVPRTPR